MCGCSYCRTTFPPESIDTWLNEGSGTAVCPHCGIDSVIPATEVYPLTPELLDAMHAYWFHRVSWDVATPLWKRLIELSLALVAAGIAGLTLWATWDTLAHPPDSGTTRLTLLSIALVLCFVSAAVLTFAARLAIPRLRKDGRIIGIQGLTAFALLYGLVVGLGLWHEPERAKPLVLAVILGALIYVAWRSTFRQRSP